MGGMTMPAMVWQPVDVLPAGLSADHGRLDAYLVWDLLTDFERHASLRGEALAGARWLPLVAELAQPAGDTLAALAAAAAAAAALAAPQAASPAASQWPDLARLLSRWDGPDGLSAIQTAIIPDSLIPALVAAVASGHLLRFQLGAPCAAPLPARAMPAPALPGWQPPGPLHTLGVIDDGCCLAHHHFRGAQGESRILWLWDQTPEAAPDARWARHARASGAPAVGYGVELSNQAITQLLQDPATSQLGEAGERRLYAAIGRPDWGPPDHTHGARVLHLLAGPEVVLFAPSAPDTAPSTASATVQAALAPVPAVRLPIVFVQLPAQCIADTSGDSLAMHVIDGARYIAARTADAAPYSSWATTINISLGGIAGPHDGSSLVEMALDALAADARVRVVVSAGNAAGDQRIHAQRSVRQHAPGDFFIALPAGQPNHSFVEFWLPDAGLAASAWTVALTPPGDAAPAGTLGAGQVGCLRTQHGQPLACVVFARQVAQGLNGTMVLLALAPTATAGPAAAGAARALAPAGVWQVQLQRSDDQRDKAPADVHAWVERDDVLVGARLPQRIRFELDSRLPRDAQYVNDRFTLSTLAHGANVIAAGATVQSSQALAPYSSRGPLRAPLAGAPGGRLPPTYAPGDRSPSQPGMLVSGFYSGQSASIGGTSAAAPQVARRLVETGTIDGPAVAPVTDPDGIPF